MNECGDYTHGLTRNLLSLQALPVFLPMVFVCVITYLKKNKEQLKNLLLNLHQDEKGVNVLLRLGAKRFVATSKEDYQPVINLAAEAGIDLKKYEYYNP